MRLEARGIAAQASRHPDCSRTGMPRDPARLEIFAVAHRLVIDVYRTTASIPAAERFGLQSQIRRAAVSITANIVEGSARSSRREYARFLAIATGSALELRYLLGLCVDLGFLSAPGVEECRIRSDHVARALQKLQQAVEALPDA